MRLDNREDISTEDALNLINTKEMIIATSSKDVCTLNELLDSVEEQLEKCNWLKCSMSITTEIGLKLVCSRVEDGDVRYALDITDKGQFISYIHSSGNKILVYSEADNNDSTVLFYLGEDRYMGIGG